MTQVLGDPAARADPRLDFSWQGRLTWRLTFHVKNFPRLSTDGHGGGA